MQQLSWTVESDEINQSRKTLKRTWDDGEGTVRTKGDDYPLVGPDLSSLGPMPTANVFAYISALAQSHGCVIKVLE